MNARHLAGDIYRMGRSEWVTEAGWQQAYDDGVRTVIDLRNPGERQRRATDPVVSEQALARFAVVHCPTEDPDNAEFRRICGPYLSHPRLYADNLRLFPALIASVFRAIAGAQGSIIVHCSAGRDRTGLIATLLLRLAGADNGCIVRHYEMGMRGINEWRGVSQIPHPYERHLAEDELAALLSDRLSSLREFADGLEVEAFLLRNGVSTDEVALLRSRLAGSVPRPSASQFSPRIERPNGH